MILVLCTEQYNEDPFGKYLTYEFKFFCLNHRLSQGVYSPRTDTRVEQNSVTRIVILRLF